MNCESARQHWELYHDSEGDSELYLQINEHLAECPSCAKWIFQQMQFEDALTSKLALDDPSDALWLRVLERAEIIRPVAASGRSRFRPLAAIAATLALAAGLGYAIWLQQTPRLSTLATTIHQEFVEQRQQVDFASESDIEVEQYLKSRVPFAVRCPPREDAGFQVRGGGICTIAGSPAAYVVGRVETEDVSIFVFPEERLAEFAQERAALRRDSIHHLREAGYEMVLATIDGNVVVVIGRRTNEQLERVVQAYGSYPEPPADNAA